MTAHSTSVLLLVVTALSLLVTAPPAAAYNDQQHQGMVAIAYKAMVGSALENGCGPAIDFNGVNVTEFLTDFPGVSECATSEQICRGRWADFLQQNERAIRYLRGVDAALPPNTNCPEPIVNTGTLGQIRFSVNPNYARSAECGVDVARIQNPQETERRCSAPALLCNDRVDQSIYQFLAPEDHTGDILGYWATEADHDVSVTAIGTKPVFPGTGRALETLDDVAEGALGALLTPLVCAIDLLFGEDDCLADAKALADAAVPIEEIATTIPVLFPRFDPDFTGLWHFIDLVDTDSPCDDVRGMLYERGGPQKVPDALDLLIIIGTELGQQTLAFSDSTGPSRFNITNPGDGDPPSCPRDRTDWEITPIGHIVFNPLDNLALHGLKEFLSGESLGAKSLGWPLHALGDAVAPHHVVGTTGWGHRPFEDAAEQNWRRILHQPPDPNDVATFDSAAIGDMRARQYQQLRRILVHGFAYWQAVNDLRAQRPGNDNLHKIPIRALVTKVAADTYAEVTGVNGAPLWPFDPGLSVPYFLELGNDKQATIDRYRDANSVDRQRHLLERGAGAMVAFLAATGQFGAAFAPAPRCGSPSALFAECGAASQCSAQCCTPLVTACAEACTHQGCDPGEHFCGATCSPGRSCDPDNCCVVVACDEPCRDSSDCSSGGCDGGCCGTIIK